MFEQLADKPVNMPHLDTVSPSKSLGATLAARIFISTILWSYPRGTVCRGWIPGTFKQICVNFDDKAACICESPFEMYYIDGGIRCQCDWITHIWIQATNYAPFHWINSLCGFVQEFCKLGHKDLNTERGGYHARLHLLWFQTQCIKQWFLWLIILYIKTYLAAIKKSFIWFIFYVEFINLKTKHSLLFKRVEELCWLVSICHVVKIIRL